ncbi:MAG TPA: sigma-70 family RNA polymerase sigma factor [Burkholderiaceae bacterium]|nr:sigma-70 family RNA polymerase sigma factor [Burkholderiaceae bacterium]
MNCLTLAWTQHAPELRSWLRRRLDQPHEVDDMLQDLFIKALRQGDQFCNIKNARAWLFEVARNALADRYKCKHEFLELPEDMAAADEEDLHAVDLLTVCLPRVMSELSQNDREVINMCDLQGLSQAEFAQRMNLSLPAAKSRIQRARERMRAHMTSACQVRFDSLGHVDSFVPRTPLSDI